MGQPRVRSRFDREVVRRSLEFHFERAWNLKGETVSVTVIEGVLDADLAVERLRACDVDLDELGSGFVGRHRPRRGGLHHFLARSTWGESAFGKPVLLGGDEFGYLAGEFLKPGEIFFALDLSAEIAHARSLFRCHLVPLGRDG